MADDKERTAESGDNGSGGERAKSLLSSLMTKEVVIPAAATAAAALAFGARKGVSEVKESAEGEAEEVGRHGVEGAKEALKSSVGGGGGVGGKLASGVASKVLGGGGGGGGAGKAKKTRRLPIQRWTDIAAPIDRVYEQWTKFEEFPEFMHRVLSVKQEDDDKVSWEEKIWFSKRQWEGEVTDRRKNRRIAWKTSSGMSHAGVVTFHKLDDDLTRVMVTMDFVPQGMIEKMASGLRFVKRAVQADLARFKAYVEMNEAKGLEYKARPAEQKSDGDDEKAQGRGENGDRQKKEDDDKSDEERESERGERESRRQERRESVSG
jgi:uncharacterized membrane protein